jgi:hypothetical protein
MVGTAFRIASGQLQVFEEALAAAKNDLTECRNGERQKAVAANLKGVLRSSLLIPPLLQQLCRSTIDLMVGRLIDDYAETGNRLREAFTRGLHILTGVQVLVQTYQEAGGSVEGAGALDRAIEDVRQLETSTFQHWPDFTGDDIAGARAAQARGECLPLDEAFAQIAGVDRETWLRRVEERKRARRS